MKRYHFPYRKEYSTLLGEVYRPVAKVYLRSIDGAWKSFIPYVDGGADISLFSRLACERLGYQLEEGERGTVGGIGGGVVKVYIQSRGKGWRRGLRSYGGLC